MLNIKTIYSAKPHKDGYKITRYIWQDNHYKNIEGIAILPNKESAEEYIKALDEIAKSKGLKTTIEKTIKWTFLTIEGEFKNGN